MSVALELAPIDSDGVVFGSGRSVVIRIPTAGTLRLTLDASAVALGR